MHTTEGERRKNTNLIDNIIQRIVWKIQWTNNCQQIRLTIRSSIIPNSKTKKYNFTWYLRNWLPVIRLPAVFTFFSMKMWALLIVLLLQGFHTLAKEERNKITKPFQKFSYNSFSFFKILIGLFLARLTWPFCSFCIQERRVETRRMKKLLTTGTSK